MTDRIVTDADRAPPASAGSERTGPADQYLNSVLDVMLKMGYSEAEISMALETVVYQRKQYGL